MSTTLNTLRAAGLRLAGALLLTASAGAGLLGCHAGTPAAPEGTEILLTCEFLSRDLITGNFEAIIKAQVLDLESDVPQVGVGVFFRVSAGPGTIATTGPVVTDNSGRAQAVLVGRGATSGNEVTVRVSSGPATADITMGASGCASSSAVPPRLVFTVSPNPARVTQIVTVNMSASTDTDCPGGKPTSWRIEWGDALTTNDTFANTDAPTHDYRDDIIPTGQTTMTVTIRITITDCQGLTATDTSTLTLQR